MNEIFELQCGSDIAAHPIAKLLRWDEGKMRRLIRLGWLQGEVNSKGEVYLSEYSLRFASYREWVRNKMAAEVLLEMERTGRVPLDFNLILLRILINQMFHVREISIEELEKIVKSHG